MKRASELPRIDENRKGWAVVGAFLERQDVVMIDDYDDDINTLLVIAGLFSAVLTAFVIESYQWLQEDFSEKSAGLLTDISAQLSANMSSQPAPPSDAATPFTPTASSVLVNSLWFLSLVLGLVAALLGMLAKQWLRAYRTLSSDCPEEIVLLRQIRWQAFVQWRVPVIIALLPAILEIALILFMAGLLVLLWNLHSTVALVTSVAVAIFLVIALGFNIAPAVFPGCPYKSPTAWVCVFLWNAINRFSYRALWTAGYLGRHSYLFRVRWHKSASGWASGKREKR